MRILQVVHQFAPHYIGGTEIYTETLAKELSRRGHEVAVLTRVARATQDRMPGLQRDEGDIRVFRWWCPAPKGVYNFFRDSYSSPGAPTVFREVLNEFRPDVVHIQHLKGLHFRLPATAAEAGARVVLTLHDYWYFCANAQLLRPGGYICGGPRWWLNCADCAAHRAAAPWLLAGAPLAAALMARRSRALAEALQAAAVIMAPSRAVAELYRQHTAVGKKLRVIEHGIQPVAAVDTRRQEVGPLRILFVGGLAWQKGVHVLVEAFTRLKPGTAQLDICGDETAFPEYVTQLKQTAKGYDVTFHGGLPHDEVIELMRQSDVLAIPSLWPETSSLVALEAQAVGLPIIASDVGALRERVATPADGWLVKPRDVLKWQTALRMVTKTQGAERFKMSRESHSLQEHADQVLKEYQAEC